MWFRRGRLLICSPLFAILGAWGTELPLIPLSEFPRPAQSQRDHHILCIAAHGRLGWQKESDYGQRALVETAIGRYKAIVGPRRRARTFSGQQAEAAVGVAVLNRMLDAGGPDSVRRLNIAA